MSEIPPADFDNLAHPSLKKASERQGVSVFEVFQAVEKKAPGSKFRLTKRQKEDLRAALLGKSFTQIARESQTKRSVQAVRQSADNGWLKVMQIVRRKKGI